MAKAKKKPAKKAAAKSSAAKKSSAPKKALKKAAKPAAKAKKAAPKAAKPAAKAAKKPVKVAAPKGKKAAPKAAPIPEKLKTKKAKERPQKDEVEAPVAEEVAVEEGEEAVEEVVLTDAEGRRYCRVRDCDQLATVDGYCRYHYLLFWKRIQIRKKILSEGKLERYIEELTARYPDKFLDILRKDLRGEKEFLAAIQELEIDESGGENEFEDEAQTYIEEVRGIGEGGGAREEEEF